MSLAIAIRTNGDFEVTHLARHCVVVGDVIGTTGIDSPLVGGLAQFGDELLYSPATASTLGDGGVLKYDALHLIVSFVSVAKLPLLIWFSSR